MRKDIDGLDAVVERLRQTEPVIAEGDFTAAVMAQVPRRNRLPVWLSNATLLGATVLGSATAAWQLRLPIEAIVLQVPGNAPIVLGASVMLVYAMAGATLWMIRES